MGLPEEKTRGLTRRGLLGLLLGGTCASAIHSWRARNTIMAFDLARPDSDCTVHAIKGRSGNLMIIDDPFAICEPINTEVVLGWYYANPKIVRTLENARFVS